ncbi:probable glutathione S-transferase parA [Chenopodium quinoa]|uniref:probable glutathione S-transferase parA n=1 Tax=Chenopodium quinoa TaxID=63459 RepID=UPI000B78BBD6|nr:probable glutathione S-transferase parA [Chenopodium quinoa]
MSREEVVVLDCWCSSCAMRVKIALAEKGVEFECKDQNLAEKGSSLLLEMNPIHKLVPVLIHNGKPICESLLIVEYIDQVWTHSSPLLPTDPYLRSQARFWGQFVDNKIYEGAKKVWRTKGEEEEKAKKEFIENLKILEGVINNQQFFGGDTLGYIDIALIPIAPWFYAFEKFGNFSIEASCPKIVTWAKRCMEKSSVSGSLPDFDKFYYSFAFDIKKVLGLD